MKLTTLLNGLILLLAFLSSAPTDPAARAGLEDAGYNIFRRYVGGVISTWDILFFSLLCLLVFGDVYSNYRVNKLINFTRNRTISIYLFCLALSVVVGLFVISVTQAEAFVVKDWFRAVVPIIYLFCTYFIVVNVVNTNEKIINLYKIMELVAGVMVLYGFYRLIDIVGGNVSTLIVYGIPIVLYSELQYFDLPIVVYLLHIWHGNKLGVIRSSLFICMIGFILACTRRMNYILLVINVLLVLSVAYKSGSLTTKMLFINSKKIVIMFCAGAVIILLAIPTLLEAVWFAIQTINMYSDIGFKYTGEFRLAQIENIFLNMNREPFTFLTGFGIGSKWQVIKALPTTIDSIGAHMAYDAKVVAEGSDWMPFFHVPYFATFFRFGILGSFCLIYVVYKLWADSAKIIKELSDIKVKILLSSFTGLVIMPILILGDSNTPTSYILLGLFLGLIESIRSNNMKRTVVVRSNS